MNHKHSKALAILLALSMVFGTMLPIYAAEGGLNQSEESTLELMESSDVLEPDTLSGYSYTGELLSVLKDDNGHSENSMFAPKEGSNIAVEDDYIVVTYVRTATTYPIMHFGTTSDSNIAEGVIQNSTGQYVFKLSKNYYGKAIPVVFVKNDTEHTKSAQNYLAIPTEDKVKCPAIKYDGGEIKIVKVNSSGEFEAYGMMAVKTGEKASAVIDGEKVKISYPTSKTTYDVRIGSVDDESGAYFSLTDGYYNIDIEKTRCGYAIPIAAIRRSDTSTGGKKGTAYETQLYLTIPRETRITTYPYYVKYTGTDVKFVTSDFSKEFGMLGPISGSYARIEGDKVSVHIVPSNKTIYSGIHWGYNDDSTPYTASNDFKFNLDDSGNITSIDFSIDASNYCGYATAVVPIKKSDATAAPSSGLQYYLAIPSKETLANGWSKGDVEENNDDYNADEGGLIIENSNIRFKPKSAFVETSGTKGEDGYKLVLKLKMDNTTYSKAFIGSATDAENATSGIVEVDDQNTFDLVFASQTKGTSINHMGKRTVVSFYSSRWNEQEFILYDDAETLWISSKAEVVTLTPSSDNKMFNIVSAAIETANEKLYLVVGMNKQGYTYFALGTEEDALANGDGRIKRAQNKWIKGYAGAQHTEGYEFRLPIEQDDNGVPCVAVSATYLATYDTSNKTDDDLDATFAPKLFAIDRENKTLKAISCANYLGVYKAIKSVPDNLNNYTTASVQTVNDALSAVERNLPKSDDNQAKIDAWAKAIEDAVAGLVRKSSGSGSGSSGTGTTTEEEVVPDESIALKIENTTAMFKAASASLDTISGKNYLTVALTGNTYHYLYKGTYRQAVSNGDKRDNWIEGYKNKSDKWEFRIPIDAKDDTVHVVSISNTYLEGYEKGENSLERAFYPRTFDIDASAKELTCGDYHASVNVTVKSTISDVKVASSGKVEILGGPNSNTYNVSPTITMQDEKFDQISYSSVENGKVVEKTAKISNKSFTFDVGKAVLWGKRGADAPVVSSFDGTEPIELTFRDKETKEDVTYPVTIDLLKNVITIGEASSGSKSKDTTTTDTAANAAANIPEEKSVEVAAEAAAVNGAATAKVAEKDVSEAITKAAKDEDIKNVEIKPTIKGEADTVTVEISKNSINEIAKSELGLVVSTEQAEVKLANEAVAELAAKGEVAVTTKAAEDESVTINIEAGGSKVDSVKGGLVVKIPVAAKAESDEASEPADNSGKVLAIIDADGNETIIKKSAIDGDTAAALLDGSCTVKLIDNRKEFDDAKTHWAGSAIDFVSSHELFGGTADKTFEPNTTMSRAMLATVLYRLEDATAEDIASDVKSFDDVPDGKWYSETVAWAASAGIVEGTGDGFDPNGDITRQQLATMLYRYAGTIGMDTGVRGKMDVFGDASEVASWASDAVSWAAGTGLIGGRDDGTIDPKATATRAETAAVLERLVKRIVK